MWETRDLGVRRGRCASCHEVADLHLRESGYRRTWRELLSTEVDERVDRRVTCSACSRTYPVRAQDDDPGAAAERSARPGRDPDGQGRRLDDQVS